MSTHFVISKQYKASLSSIVLKLMPFAVVFTFLSIGLHSQSVWKPLKTGAGGWITGLSVHPSGNPVYARSDVGGAYRFLPDEGEWVQLVTDQSMPAEDVYWQSYMGVLSVVSAPSDVNVAYMAFNRAVYRSSDQGSTWIKTALTDMDFGANSDASKFSGERLAVHPLNADIVYMATIDAGLWRSSNGGVSWGQVADIPLGNPERGPRQVLFGADGNLLYCTVDEEGVWRSLDAGNTWENLNFNFSNPHFLDAEIDGLGNLFVCGENNGSTFQVQRFDGDGWNSLTDLDYVIKEIALDPFEIGRAMLFSYGFSQTYRTSNIYADNPSWTSLAHARQADGIPWLDNMADPWFVLGEIVFDPNVEDKLWISDGVGVWNSIEIDGPTSLWIENSKGQEHLVSNDVQAFPSGKVLTAHWDFCMFLHDDLDAYPQEQQPINRFNSAWSIDASPSDPDFAVAVITDHRFCCYDGFERNSSYTQDGGVSWTRFESMPGDTESFGLIAVSATDNSNIVWLPVFNQMPYFTLDMGQSWTQAELPGASDNCCVDQFFWKRWVLTADRVLANTFYLYDWGDGSVFKSVDGGATWTRQAEVLNPWSFHAKLKSVPGHAGHLLFVNGPEQSESLIEPLARSTDGGLTWEYLENTDLVLDVALGKAAVGAMYPTIFILGKVDDIFGYHLSIDEGATWQFLGTNVGGIYDHANLMEGDPFTFGRLYIGYAGSGFFYHDLNTPNSIVELNTESTALATLYPNPAQQDIRVSLSTEGRVWAYRIFDTNGKTCKRGSAASSEEIIDIGNLDAGAYFIEIRSQGGSVEIHHFLKQ